MSTVRQLKLNLLADTSDFQAGIKRATGETESFQHKLKKSALAIGKSFAIAGAAAGAMALKIGVDSVKAALEDQKSQRRLAVALKNTTGATAKQVKAVEKYITKASLANGIADDELRPAFQRLTQVTKSTTKAQDLMNLALDVSAGTGKSVESVSVALAKAYGGQLAGLKKLGISLDANTLKNKDTKKAFEELAKTYSGQALQASQSLEGKMKRLSVAIGETKESIGVALLPFVERLATFITEKGVPAIEGFVGAFTGKDGKGLDGIALSAYNLGQKLKAGIKYVIDHKDDFAAFAVAWGTFWAANKALVVTTGIVKALGTIRAAMAATTAASALAASAEAAATGGTSLIPAIPAIAAIAAYFGTKVWSWSRSNNGGKTGISKGHGTTNTYAEITGGSSVAPFGTPYGADTGGSYGTRNPLRQTQVTNVFNLNGIVDAESARRTIERVLQQSSLRTQPLNFVGSSI